MKDKIKEVIVVEGKNDTLNLRRYFDVDTIETHGLGINNETIEYIKEISKTRGIILMLDPDSPGEKIRNRINSAIPNLKNVFLDKKEARTTKKVGIEHATYEVLKKGLENQITYTDNIESLSLQEFNELGLNGNIDSSIKRELIYNHYHLGKCNAKTLFKRLNMIGATKQDIEKLL